LEFLVSISRVIKKFRAQFPPKAPRKTIGYFGILFYFFLFSKN